MLVDFRDGEGEDKEGHKDLKHVNNFNINVRAYSVEKMNKDNVKFSLNLVFLKNNKD